MKGKEKEKGVMWKAEGRGSERKGEENAQAVKTRTKLHLIQSNLLVTMRGRREGRGNLHGATRTKDEWRRGGQGGGSDAGARRPGVGSFWEVRAFGHSQAAIPFVLPHTRDERRKQKKGKRGKEGDGESGRIRKKGEDASERSRWHGRARSE
ncbi:hypothetical protein BJV74DRAFT_795852 [Russula compacta]|nr:hypothetical protein BJV74DRAFT_795852 [Russula compacta]